MSDELLFAEEDSLPSPMIEDAATPWKVLVVDDDDTVHQITRLVLKHLTFDNRPLQLIEAHSGSEAINIMANEKDDIALAIIDVVMESDDAGFQLVKAIREDHGNHITRLVLRTGQPGIAPEEKVIQQYDINDYKEKTELTGIKLKTLIYSTLRSYRDIQTIEMQRRSLEKVIRALRHINQAKTMPHFASAILEQMVTLMNHRPSAIYCIARRNSSQSNHYTVLAASGELNDLLNTEAPLQEYDDQTLPKELQEAYALALEEHRSIHTKHAYVVYHNTSSGSESLLYIKHGTDLDEHSKYLMEIFSADVIATYQSLLLQEEIKTTQSELIYILGEAVEKRSKETGAHVKRVAEISALLAREYGCSEIEVENIKVAAPLHDLGKIAIPDSILNKPGKLTPDEWSFMQRHAEIGSTMLSSVNKPIFETAATIAGNHHERWDGSGYPNALCGEDIPLLGRITALADVFDALNSVRCYKPAWPLEQSLEYISNAKGEHFDPTLVDLFLKNIDVIIDICKRYPD